MKRSKVLKKIEKLLYKHVGGIDPSPIDFVDAAEAVLEAVEKMGMKPPHSKERDLDCECGCKGWCAKGNHWDYEHRVNWKALGGKEGRQW